ncbi:MAG: RNA-binding protein [Actinomycetia bacterium]|nr:RNA-binding protein [Actinomycetes bacterium]
MKLYVGNLGYSTSSEDVRAAFEEFGTVDSADVIMDRSTGRSKGFGFVEMENIDEAKAAMGALDGKELDGRPIKVNEARPRKDDSRGSRRY